MEKKSPIKNTDFMLEVRNQFVYWHNGTEWYSHGTNTRRYLRIHCARVKIFSFNATVVDLNKCLTQIKLPISRFLSYALLQVPGGYSSKGSRKKVLFFGGFTPPPPDSSSVATFFGNFF